MLVSALIAGLFLPVPSPQPLSPFLHRPHYFARQSALIHSIREQHGPANDGVLDTLGSLDQSGFIPRQVIDPFGWGYTNCIRIEKNEVGIHSCCDASFVRLSEKRGRLGGESPDSLFKRHRLAFAHPLAQ